MWAVFIHYLGDAISSGLVLGTGALMHYFDDKKWIVYADPASRYVPAIQYLCRRWWLILTVFSLLIVAIVLATTIPLVRSCAAILMQRTPGRVKIKKMKQDLRTVS
jgi:zinc transporter 1